MTVQIIHGDMLAVLPTMEDGSVDSVVTDPPYELNFMSRSWDNTGIAFRPETWRQVLRVLKPGAFLVAFASTRGYHRMTCAIEDAGFVIHPMLGWIFGTGFPKATRFKGLPDLDGWRYGLQALKPALEPICLAQKPLDGTGPENWRKHGVGGLHIDACRVETGENLNGGRYSDGKDETDSQTYGAGLNKRSALDYAQPTGRWPANVLHDGSDEVLEAFAAFGETGANGGSGKFRQHAWMERETGQEIQRDKGSAARFFYSAKANKTDRAGSKHPTVKPLSLMRWLCTLVTPPGGHILDPFAGSGTTLQAAHECGFDATGVEQEAEYVADIKRRLQPTSRPVNAELFV